jgi:hypothetical protein
MSETEAIAKMAEKLSSEIFGVFGWKKVGPVNQNWTCVEQEKHFKKKALTHPSDAVFKYKDPYGGLDQYVTLDLKSLGKDSIQAKSIIAALKSLCQCAECGLKSESWQKLFLQPGDNATLAGLLFVYNHDNEYDKNFDEQLTKITPSKIGASGVHRVYAMGPRRVNYLATIANDIIKLRGLNKLPDQAFCQFYYPDLTTYRPEVQLSPVATIESLLGPWIVIRYEQVVYSDSVLSRGHYVYYDGPGESEDEFQYVIDYLFRFQIVDGMGPVEIRLANGCATAAAHFDKAKAQYLKLYWPLLDDSKKESKNRMKRLSSYSISTQITKFAQTELGFDHG